MYSKSLVIALNDAEWIHAPDISIFHEPWVEESIESSGFKSSLYLTSTDFRPSDKDYFKLAYQPLVNDGADVMMSRLLDLDSLEVEEVMLMTALKLALIVAEIRGAQQEVFLVGFDFESAKGFSKHVPTGFNKKNEADGKFLIDIQRHFLSNAIYMLRERQLSIFHVGSLDISTLTPSQVNERNQEIYSGKAFQSEASPIVLVTAEITTNHFGDRSRLERLVREARIAGADLVKFQKRNVETFYSKKQLSMHYSSPFGETFGDYRRALELDREDFEFIENLCMEIGIQWFLSTLDLESYEFAKEVGPAMIKLPSTISEHREFLAHVADDFTGDLVLSTGMTDESYENWVLSIFQKQERLFLLHANSAYPTPDSDCNIDVIRRYSRISETRPQLIPGWSSHDMGWFGSVMAVGAGARMVEKHVKLGNTEWAHFDAVAMDMSTSEFKEYVKAIRRAEIILGTSEKTVRPSEHHKYQPVNRQNSE